jgi:hypothetical protein
LTWQAIFQPLYSRIPAAEIDALSDDCIDIALSGAFAKKLP